MLDTILIINVEIEFDVVVLIFKLGSEDLGTNAVTILLSLLYQEHQLF